MEYKKELKMGIVLLLQLSVKAFSNGHNLVGRTCDNCRIIVKLINYSPKRTSHFEEVRASDK